MTVHTKRPTFTDAEVRRELQNDSLGTIDTAYTTYTDPKDDLETVPESDRSSGIEP